MICGSAEDIGNSAFSYNALTDITVQGDAKNVAYRQFYACDSLKNAVIDTGIECVEAYAFAECKAIESVTIAKTVTEIETGAFENCCGIETVKYEGSEEEWSQIQIDIKNENLLNADIIYNSSMPAAKRIVFVDVKQQDGVFIVTPTGMENGEAVVFVCYKDNRLSYIKSFVYDGAADISFKPDAEYDEVKVMAWESLNSMIPLCDADYISFFIARRSRIRVRRFLISGE